MVSTASVDISTLTPVTPQGTPLFYVPTTGGTYSGTVTLDGSPPLVIPSGGYVPQTQSFALANLAAENSFNFTITGQTDDPLPAFGVLANSRTYGGIQGPVSWFGYNPVHAQAGGSSSHSSAVLSFFADAGDTNSSGAHGVEINLSWFSPDYSKACGAFQMVAVDDNTGTLHTILRCGTGTSGAYTSFIAFQDASAATTFMSMDESSSSIWTYVPFAPKGGNPFTVQASSGNTNVLFTTGGTASASTVVTIAAIGASGTAELILNGNNGSGANGEILFQTNGTTQWELAGTPPYLYIKDIVNNRSALYMYPGSTAAASNFQVNSKLQSLSSLIVGSAALTTTATDGFLYLPTCAGVPTGTPTAQTGTSAAVYDTTDNKLYVYNGGWKSAALS